MNEPASPFLRPVRRGPSRLLIAWLALLAVVTAGATYVILTERDAAPSFGSSASVTLDLPAPADDSAMTNAADSDSEPAGASEAPEPETAASTASLEAPPWRRYAAAFQAGDGAPRIAVVLTGLGLSSALTETVIADLPAEVTLSFTPYAPDLPRWIDRARRDGHEVMLDLPMEPTGFPDRDPGPRALLTHLDDAENRQRLAWVLARAEGYVGLAAAMGSRFAASEARLRPILEEVKARGLMYLDNGASADSVAGEVADSLGLPHAVNDRALDDSPLSPLAIDARLAQIERVAARQGASVVMSDAHPATLARLRDWLATAESRGFALVPVTAVARGAS